MVVIAMSIIVFLGVYAIGNPIDVMIDPASDQALREALIQRYGFDRSLIEQYFIFMGNMLHGDLGESFIYRLPVLSLILSRFPATLELALTAMMIATCLGIPLGLWAGYKPDAISSKTHHGPFRPRLQRAELLGRAAAHHDVRGRTRLAALRRARADHAGARHEPVDHLARRMELHHPAGLQSRAVQARPADPPDAGRHGRGHELRLCALRPRAGPLRRQGRRPACAEEHLDSRS